MTQFLWGALAATCGVAGLLFLRSWRTGRDRLLLVFAIAFWVFALNWVALAVLRPADESRHYVYLIRLAAYLLLIAGVVDKNRRPPA
jgi:hypothetical protein